MNFIEVKKVKILSFSFLNRKRCQTLALYACYLLFNRECSANLIKSLQMNETLLYQRIPNVKICKLIKKKEKCVNDLALFTCILDIRLCPLLTHCVAIVNYYFLVTPLHSTNETQVVFLYDLLAEL